MIQQFRKDIHIPSAPTQVKFKKPPRRWRKKSKIKLAILSVVAIFTAAAVLIWWFWEIPLASPINQLSSFRFLRESEIKSTPNKVVYGFVPYWNLKKAIIQPELTHFAYFSLTVGADGSLLQTIDGESDPGFSRLSSDEFLELSNQTLAQQGAVDLVLAQFNADDITTFLGSKKAQENLIMQLDNILLAYPFNGINIDIELNGSGTDQLRNNLSEFMRLLRAHLDTKYSHITLSIDMYAGAASGQQLWDVEAIGKEVDYIVVMAYDFHRRTSPQAGPVAPLFGGRELWDSDINQHLQAFIEKVPKEKILLGVPFYGYEWQTTSRDSQSHTFPDTGATASVERVIELLKNKEEFKVQEHWNEYALSPYLSYEEDGNIYVIYYENPRSISYKLDYVNQLDIAGIAIWALGYEGQGRDLWEVVNQKVR